MLQRVPPFSFFLPAHAPAVVELGKRERESLLPSAPSTTATACIHFIVPIRIHFLTCRTTQSYFTYIHHTYCLFTYLPYIYLLPFVFSPPAWPVWPVCLTLDYLLYLGMYDATIQYHLSRGEQPISTSAAPPPHHCHHLRYHNLNCYYRCHALNALINQPPSPFLDPTHIIKHQQIPPSPIPYPISDG